MKNDDLQKLREEISIDFEKATMGHWKIDYKLIKRQELIHSLANAMGKVGGKEIEKLNQRLGMYENDRLKRILDVYLMKPDFMFAIENSETDFDVEKIRHKLSQNISKREIRPLISRW